MRDHPVDLRLAGQTVTGIRPGHTTQLHFSGGGWASIENTIEVRGGTLAALRGQVVRTATARPTGELEIVFASGATLLAGVDPRYESWNVGGPDGFLVVCTPGGELTVWSPRPAVTYHGAMLPGRAEPVGVVRRTRDGGRVVDEAFTRNLRWEPTSALAAHELGRGDVEYEPITEQQADAFVERVTRKLRS